MLRLLVVVTTLLSVCRLRERCRQTLALSGEADDYLSACKQRRLSAFLLLGPATANAAGSLMWFRMVSIQPSEHGTCEMRKSSTWPLKGIGDAGQKLVFWSQTLLILFVSGLVIWDQYFYEYTTIEQKRVAVLVHAFAALLAILVWIVHVYAAIWVRGTIRAVTGGWAWRHHRKWLRQEVSKEGR